MLPRGFELPDQSVDQLFLTFLGNRTLAQGDTNGACQLVPIKRNAPSVRLVDGKFAELNALDGRKTLRAC